MKVPPISSVVPALIALSLPACARMHAEEREQREEHSKIVVTSPKIEDVVLTEQYVCQIRSQRHINVCAYANGYIEEVLVKEGQRIKKGTPMFKVGQALYRARFEAEAAEAELARQEFNNTRKLFEDKVVSDKEVALLQAKLDKAVAKKKLAEAELNFTTVNAPFDGIVDKLEPRNGSLIKEGEVLTTLSDNSVMWVYFNVPEARYLDYMASENRDSETRKIDLVLANGNKFKHPGTIGAIEAKFNNETGNIPFRADFPNPEGLLRHGQTGSVLIHRTLHNAVVIPQRATFELLEKRYVYVVGQDKTVQRREIDIEHEMDDIFVIKKGLAPTDSFVLEGVRQVRDGEKVAGYEVRKPEEVLANLKNHAE
jgi:membrane fusion protein (multidrug efflux system)